jgi:hypothetical protein
MASAKQKDLDVRIEKAKRTFNSQRKSFSDTQSAKIQALLGSIYRTDSKISKASQKGDDVSSMQANLDSLLKSVEAVIGNTALKEGTELTDANRKLLDVAVTRFRGLNKGQKMTMLGDTKTTLGGKMEDLLSKIRMAGSAGRDDTVEKLIKAMHANMDLAVKKTGEKLDVVETMEIKMDNTNESILAKAKTKDHVEGKGEELAAKAMKRFNSMSDKQKASILGDTQTTLAGKIKELEGLRALKVKNGGDGESFVKAMHRTMDLIDKRVDESAKFDKKASMGKLEVIDSKFNALSADKQAKLKPAMDKLHSEHSAAVSKQDAGAVFKIQVNMYSLMKNGKVNEASEPVYKEINDAIRRFQKMSKAQKSAFVGDTKITLATKINDLKGLAKLKNKNSDDLSGFAKGMHAAMDLVEKSVNESAPSVMEGTLIKSINLTFLKK